MQLLKITYKLYDRDACQALTVFSRKPCATIKNQDAIEIDYSDYFLLLFLYLATPSEKIVNVLRFKGGQNLFCFVIFHRAS